MPTHKENTCLTGNGSDEQARSETLTVRFQVHDNVMVHDKIRCRTLQLFSGVHSRFPGRTMQQYDTEHQKYAPHFVMYTLSVFSFHCRDKCLEPRGACVFHRIHANESQTSTGELLNLGKKALSFVLLFPVLCLDQVFSPGGAMAQAGRKKREILKQK